MSSLVTRGQKRASFGPAMKVLGSPHSTMVRGLCHGHYDAPIDLTVGAHALADSDYGVTIHPVVRDVTRRFALR